MTGFGRGESSNGERRFIVEIRTVNHRYCDIAVRMPRTFSGLEDRLRQAVTQKIRRGKIDVYVGAEEFGGREREIVVDIGLARAYINAANELKANFTLRDDMSLSTLLRMPDIFRIDDVSPEEDEIWELMGSAAQSALDALLSMRAREGAKLIADVKSRIDLLASLLTHIEKRAPLIVDDYRERLNSRLKELLGQNIPDENRIATEIAIFADKCGIDEEITRFRSHLAQAGRCCV
jgi:uncharacterized protein (TIGR00255 family)